MSIDEQQHEQSAELRGTSREQLLDAAATVFAERGYRGASVEAIAAAAGVTKGALYWNFESKSDLFFSLLEERVDQRLRLLADAADAIAGEETVTPLVSREVSSVVDEERQIHLLTHEYWALAARDPELGARYAERQRTLREMIARSLVAHHEATCVPLTHDPLELATAVLALGNGLGMDRIVDPDAVPITLFGEILQLIYDGLVLRSAADALRPEGEDVPD
jgi:AcrR family transcriptional regulator